MKGRWIVLIAWYVYVSQPATVQSLQTGRTYNVADWVAKDRYLNREFCESKAKEYRRQGYQAICQWVND